MNFHLRDTGSINDLRLLDEPDYAHQLEAVLAGPLVRRAMRGL
jgi:hypothetical protein